MVPKPLKMIVTLASSQKGGKRDFPFHPFLDVEKIGGWISHPFFFSNNEPKEGSKEKIK